MSLRSRKDTPEYLSWMVGDAAAMELAAFLKSPKATDRADDDLTLLLAALAG